jgi:hypothetical protein
MMATRVARREARRRGCPGGKAMNEKKEPKPEKVHFGECGVTHDDCPNSWKGTCDRSPGHAGSHHCSKCQMVF